VKDYMGWLWPHGVVEDGCRPYSSLDLQLFLHVVQNPRDGPREFPVFGTDVFHL